MRNQQIVNIRLLATFVVVLGHSIMLYHSGWASIPVAHHESATLDWLKCFIDTFQMTLFFSLSGFLFVWQLQRRPQGTFFSFFKNKVRRLMIPYWFLMITFLPLARFVSDHSGGRQLTALWVLKNAVLMRGEGHLWFLPSLLLLFAVFFFLFRFRRKPLTLLLLCFAVSFVACLGLYDNIPFHATDALKKVYWFALGGICADTFCNRLNINNLVGGGKHLLLVPFCLNAVGVWQYISDACAFVLIADFLSVSSFIVWVYLSVPDKRLPALAQQLDKDSFAIYLFHVPCIYLIYHYCGMYSPVLVVTLCLVASYMVSCALAWVIRKCRLSFLIGEKK